MVEEETPAKKDMSVVVSEVSDKEITIITEGHSWSGKGKKEETIKVDSSKKGEAAEKEVTVIKGGDSWSGKDKKEETIKVDSSGEKAAEEKK